MQIRHANLVFGACLLMGTLSAIPPAGAGTTALFVTGDNASDVASAAFDSFTAGPLTENGKYVFSADLELGPGGVTTAEDQGVWWFDGTSSSLWCCPTSVLLN